MSMFNNLHGKNHMCFRLLTFSFHSFVGISLVLINIKVNPDQLIGFYHGFLPICINEQVI